MKKILFLLILVTATLSVSSQTTTWNIKLGAGSTIGDGSSFAGKLGVGLEKSLSANWSIMPSLEFAKRDQTLHDPNIYYKNCVIHDKAIQIPCLVAYRFYVANKMNLVLKAGPYFGYSLSGSGFGGENAGVIAGLNLEFKHIFVGAEYEHNLYHHDEENLKAIYFTLGYKF